jgi:murein peptide amidase A
VRRAAAAALALAATLLPVAGVPAAGTQQAGEVRVVGRSVLGRPIAVQVIGDPHATRTVLVVGCVHGDECAGRAVVARLTEAPELVPAGVRLLLVRNANPDGLVRGTRQNARGVDLNRNAAEGWRDLGPRGVRFHAGRRAFSEPETRALRALILFARPDLTLWYHQPLALVDLPEQGPVAAARRYAALTGLPAQRLRAYPGSLSRWQNARVRAGSAFVVELPGGRLRARDAERHAAAVLTLAAG